MKKYSKFLAVLLAVAMILPGLAQAGFAAEGLEVKRLSGDNRSLTSIEVSKEVYKDGANAVVLAGYGGSADALTGTLLAAAKDAPLLVVAKAGVTSELKAEIARLGATKVYILGGETAVPASVKTDLEALELTVERVNGDNRYATAAKVAEGAANAENVFLALGRAADNGALADALAIGPVSAKNGMPVLLTRTDKLPEETVKALKDLGVKNVTIIGGAGAVSAAVKAELEALGLTVDRVGGANRYETSALIAGKYFDKPASLILANGRVDFDALVGGYLGVKKNAPVLLTRANSLADETKAYMEANRLDTYVLGGKSVVEEAVVTEAEAVLAGEEVEDLKVVSVSAINANKIQVVFNGDASEGEFTVKKGSVAIGTEVKFSEDGKEVVLTKDSGDYTTGEYTVEAKFGEEVLTAELEIEASKVTEIELGTNAIKVGPNVAINSDVVVDYKVLNQYGDNITTKATDIRVSASLGTGVTVDAKKGTITTVGYNFSAANAVKSVVVTIVDPETGVTASASLPVVDAVEIAEFSLKDVELPEKATRILENKEEAATIGFTAKDQYGKDVKDPTTGIQLISSDSTAADFAWATDVDGNYYIKVTTYGVTEAKNVILTAVNRVTGTTTSVTIKVEKPSAPKTLTFGEFDKDVLAVGDTVYMDVEVKDQYDEVLAPKDYVGAAHTLAMSTGASIAFEANKYDKNYGKIKIDLTGAAEGPAVITASKGTDVKTKTVTIKAARALAEIVAPKTQTLVQGASADLKFKFYDQYDVEIKNADLTDKASPSSYKITLTRASGDEGAVVLKGLSLGEDESALKTITVDAANGKTGSYKVKVELFDKDLVGGAVPLNAKVVSEATVTVNVIANDAEGLTYALAEIDPLVFDGSATAANGKSAYEKAVKVIGTDANGNEVTINPSQITAVELVNDNSYFGVSATAITGQIEDFEGYYTVAAIKAYDKDDVPAAKVRVTLNTADGLKVLETALVLSQETPKIEEVVLVDKKVTTTNPFKLADDTNIVDELTFADAAALKAGTISSGLTNVYVYTLDQFGVYTEVTTQDVIINSTSLISLGQTKDAKDDKLTIASGALKLVANDATDANEALTQFSAGKEIKLSVMVAGKTASLNIIIAAETPPTLTTALAGTTGIAASASGKIEFSEEINGASKAAVVTAVANAIQGTDVKASDLEWSWSVDGKTLTIKNNHDSETVKFNSVTIKVKDLYGNESLDLTIITNS